MGVVERDEAREEREERERMKAKQSDERREGGREEERPKTTRTTTKIRKKNYREMIGISVFFPMFGSHFVIEMVKAYSTKI